MIAALLLISAHPLPTPPQAAPVDLKEQSASFKKLVKGKDSENEIIAVMDGLLQRWQGNAKTIQNLEDMIEIKEGKISEHKKAIKKLALVGDPRLSACVSFGASPIMPSTVMPAAPFSR